ncbi:MAG: group II intron maturase-specific domain-containing protein [Gammaproteobacteria bacterium]
MYSKPTVKAEAPARVAGSQGAGRKPGALSPGAEVGSAASGRTNSEDQLLMERVVERSNMRLAYERVVRNKGAAGVEKSAVGRPWERTFLGYSFTAHRAARLRIAPHSVRRFRQRVRALLRAGRGRSLSRTIATLKPLLRGWINYFCLTQTKGVLEQLDRWLRRRLRCLLWRQWKRGRTRARKLRARGLSPDEARRAAGNGYGPWWNAGARHMNLAFPTAYFTRLGLVPLLATQQRLQSVR